MFKYIILVLVLVHVSSAKLYRNYTLYRTVPVNVDHLKFFENLTSKYDINFWREPGAVWKPIEFVISPLDKDSFLALSDENGIYLTTLYEDVQSLFDKHITRPYQRSNTDSFGWDNYYTLEDIYSWLQDLAKQHPQSVKAYSIGKTAENRNIMAVRISHNKEKRPAVLIDGGIHAREWVAVAFVTYLINELVARSTNEVKNITKAYEFFIIPVLNPDGYVYSHHQDRLWRKNKNYEGHGVDLNRNFDIVFGKIGSSHVVNDENFCGPEPFSEPETVAFKELVESLNSTLKYYLSFHAYGQALIIPYLYSEEHQDYYTELEKIGTEAINRLYERYQTAYRIGTGFETLGYKASGSSLCWVKQKHKVPVTFLFELRDKGNYGFGLPPKYIKPTCQETIDAVLTILNPKSFHPSFKNVASSPAPLKPKIVTTTKEAKSVDTTKKAKSADVTKKVKSGDKTKEVAKARSKAKKNVKQSKRKSRGKAKALKNGQRADYNGFLLYMLFFTRTFVIF